MADTNQIIQILNPKDNQYKEKEQTIVDETLHWKIKIEQHEHDGGWTWHIPELIIKLNVILVFIGVVSLTDSKMVGVSIEEQLEGQTFVYNFPRYLNIAKNTMRILYQKESWHVVTTLRLCSIKIIIYSIFIELFMTEDTLTCIKGK